MAALDIQLNIETYKKQQQISALNNFQHPYQIVEEDAVNFDDLLMIRMIRKTIKHLFQLQSFVP